MAYYLVRARPAREKLPQLRARLESGEIAKMRPFGSSLDESLRGARITDEGAVWEEEDYCRPPLAMERDAILDHYFQDLRVEPVKEGEGWRRIDALPSLWDETRGHGPAGTRNA